MMTQTLMLARAQSVGEWIDESESSQSEKVEKVQMESRAKPRARLKSTRRAPPSPTRLAADPL